MVRPSPARPVGLLVKIFPKLSETFILEEVLGLERLGVPLVIYTLATPTDSLQHPAVAQVKARVQPVPAAPWRRPLDLLWRHLQTALATPGRWLGALRQAATRGGAAWGDFARAGWLAAQLRADGVAHLHTHFISRTADVAELMSAMSGLPFSISAHAKDIYLSDPAALRRKMSAARFTVTCTDFNCRTLQGIAPAADVRRMYHGIDAQVFHPSRRVGPALVPMILSVGRLRQKKGLDTLVRACAVLAGRGLPFRCEIVGYGEEEARLRALITELDLQHQVQLTGKLARDQVLDRYARADVYVQPSRIADDGDRDGIPNVLLEAMATGVPVVATAVSGIPELVVNGHNGLLVEADDIAALADAIARLIEQPALGRELATAARHTVTTHFDNDHNLRLVLQLLETAHEHAPNPAVA